MCIIPARDEADELAGAMLARLLPGAQLFSAKSLASEKLERLSAGCRTVCISRGAAARREPRRPTSRAG